jgi:hypothetical protein
MSYDICDPRRRIIEYTGIGQVPGEFYRDYSYSNSEPILEFTFSQQRCLKSWIITQYGHTQQEVEGVPELDWLRTLLVRGCPLDAFAYVVENEDSEKPLKLILEFTLLELLLSRIRSPYSNSHFHSNAV